LRGHIAEQVRARREALGLTQDEVAAACLVSRTSITNIEAARQFAPLDMLYMLCIVLDCQTHDLLPDIRIVNAEMVAVLRHNRLAELAEAQLKRINEVLDHE